MSGGKSMTVWERSVTCQMLGIGRTGSKSGSFDWGAWVSTSLYLGYLVKVGKFNYILFRIQVAVRYPKMGIASLDNNYFGPTDQSH